MIYQNVPAVLFEALKRSGCIMYSNGDGRIESVSIMKILSVYGDRIIVYNYDKSLRVRFLATNLVMFRVNYIDNFYHIFTVPMPLPEEFVENVKRGDQSALMFGDDSDCQAIAMALNALDYPPFIGVKRPSPLFSSVSELPIPIQDQIYDKVEDGQDAGLINPYPLDQVIAHEKDNVDEYVVAHYAPMEDIQANFDPWALTDRGRIRAGYEPNEQTRLEKICKDDEINIACTMTELQNMMKDPDVPIRPSGPPYYVGNDVYAPALIKVVDEVEPQRPIEPVPPPSPVKKLPADLSKCDIVAINGNPIGYVIEPPAKPSKKK